MSAYLSIVPSALLLLGALQPAARVNIPSIALPFDIRAQRLADALNELGRQSKMDIPRDLSLCPEIATSGVHGTLTVERALEALLRGTGLRYEVLNAHAISVLPPSPKALVKLVAAGADRVKLCGAPKVPTPLPPQKPVETNTPEAAEVVVTGTHIRDTTQNTLPILSYSRLDIEALGFGSLQEFFQKLPQNLPYNSPTTYAIGDGHNGGRGTGINLLGLGEQATLVLINGHRIAPSALGDFVDISLIPLAALERVEILRGGDAAIYGADAVAGVVNIILRDSFEGAATSLRYGIPSHSHADEVMLAQTMGTSWDKGNVLASLTADSDHPLLGKERSFSGAPGYDLTPKVRGYIGYMYFSQKLRADLVASLDLIYARRDTIDDMNYVLDGIQVGPYHQYGITDQYTLAPKLTWTLSNGWRAVADLDFSENRFTQTTTYGADATVGAATYRTLSEARIRTADIRADGPVEELPGGDARLAVGIGGRWEDYRSAGSVIGTFEPGAFSRDDAAGYVELQIPAFAARNAQRFFRELAFFLAVRAEKYSDAGFTANPRLGAEWKPYDTLRIHGSYDTSFATARYSDTLMQYNSLVIQRVTGPECASGSCLVAEEFGANSQYSPERSTSLNIGLDWSPEPLTGLQVQSSGYLIRYRDQIAAPPDISALLARPGDFTGLVFANPSSSMMSAVMARAATYPQGVVNLAGSYDTQAFDYYIDSRTRNLAQTLATGVDLDIRYKVKTSLGNWTYGIGGTRVLKLENRASADSPYVSVADTYAHPISRHYQGSLGLDNSWIAANLRLSYVGRYLDDQLTPPIPVSSWTTLDASLAVPLHKLLSSLGEDSRVQLVFDNIMNRAPPYAPTPLVPIGYDPVNANALGRVFAIEIVVRWGTGVGAAARSGVGGGSL